MASNADSGWHFKELVGVAGVFWSVVVAGVFGLLFRAGAVFQQHLELVGMVKGIKEDLRAMREASQESGEKRDRERDALRLELKGDIAALHKRVDEALAKR